MRAAYKIEVSDPMTPDLVHRFRNFGEDVYRELRDICSVSIEEIDASTNSFIVGDIHKRDLGTVTLAIRRAIKKHGFEETSSLVRLDTKHAS